MSPRNRRLVPMPIKRAAINEPPPPHWTDNLATKIRATPPWVLFAWLAVTAVVYAFFGRLVLFITAVVLLIRGWWWATNRFPRTMIIINFFLAALFSGGRRRRW
jgi:hypothetical protein